MEQKPIINYIKGSLAVLKSYSIALLIALIFSYPFLKYYRVYFSITFLLVLFFIYTEMWELAQKERRPQYNIPHYPLKGLVLGFIGFSPFILIQLIKPFININVEGLDFVQLKHLIINILLAPLFFFIKLGDETIVSYAIATIIVPIIAMLGYLAGLKDFRINRMKKKPAKVKKKM